MAKERLSGLVEQSIDTGSVAAFGEVNYVILHHRPVVHLLKYFVGQRLAIQMVPTYSFMYLLKGILGFERMKASKEW